MKNILIVIIGLILFSSVISIISPDKKNVRLVNIVIVCYMFLVLTGAFKGNFSDIVSDYTGIYDDMIGKINIVAERNNELITEKNKGLE